MDANNQPLIPGLAATLGEPEPFTPDNPEIVIGFVGAVGVNLKHAEEAAQANLEQMGYEVIRVRVTTDVFPKLDPSAAQNFRSDFDRIWKLMDVGTDARKKHGNDVAALGVAAEIRRRRQTQATKSAYFVHSLKHPEEVRRLRELYPWGFYLIGVHSPPESRRKYLGSLTGIGRPEANKLMERDRKENRDFGQQLVETFHLSDFFAGWEESDDAEAKTKSIQLLKHSIDRFFEIMFGHPYRTPTFGEYAMFLAFSTALRSADLSRQVGAVIARDGEILGMGANDCPRSGGGLYWPTLDPRSLKFEDFPLGRDWTRKGDPNRKEQISLVSEIVDIVKDELTKNIKSRLSESNISEHILRRFEVGLFDDLHRILLTDSRIADLTEYGRVVHAEMEALLSCARTGVSTIGATLYSTTFPCHNCAKHIIAAGIKRVVFIEPYLKSRAMSFHNEAIEIAYPVLSNRPNDGSPIGQGGKVRFEPFFGVGPRKFFALFSMEIGSGHQMIRKERPSGGIKEWSAGASRVRVQMMRDSYLDREREAAERFGRLIGQDHACSSTVTAGDAAPQKPLAAIGRDQTPAKPLSKDSNDTP
jgi:cytidine deaminase